MSGIPIGMAPVSPSYQGTESLFVEALQNKLYQAYQVITRIVSTGNQSLVFPSGNLFSEFSNH